MFSVPEQAQMTTFLDVSAMVILVGLLIHTTIYRRRKGVDDILFFTMLIVTIVMTCADAFNYRIQGKPISGLIMYGDTIFSICFVVFGALYCIYLDYRLYQDPGRMKKIGILYSLPAAILVLVIIGNLFGGYMFSVDAETHVYSYGTYYELLYVPYLFYLIICAYYIFKIDKKVLTVYLMLFLTRWILRSIVQDASSTTLFFAVALSYTHIHLMNHSFYEED